MRYCTIHSRAFVPSHTIGKHPNGSRRMAPSAWEPFPMQKYEDAVELASLYGCSSSLRILTEPCDLCEPSRPIPEGSLNERIRQRRIDFPAMYEMYFNGNKSFASVARHFGLSRQRVHELIKDSGLPLRKGYGK